MWGVYRRNMKSAKEMFSDLGFDRWDYPGTIEYSISDNEEIIMGPNTVLFEFDDKEVSLFDGSDHVLLNMNLFKVIARQLEELGWLE